MRSLDNTLTTSYRNQYTLQKEVSFSGIGIHTGAIVDMRFVPAKEGTGVVFKRPDLPNKPEVPARIEYVVDTSRCTTIGVGKVHIHTVEHVLAALKAYNIDNLIIEVSNLEPPVGNGSSDVFVEMIEKAGICEQQAKQPIVKLQKPVYFSKGNIQIVGIPYNGYKVSYTLNYPGSPVLRSQFQSLEINSKIFKEEIAPCRTFSLYNEISALIDKEVIKGGSLDNAVVIKEDAVISKEGLFFPDEMCRHKILDLIGDLFLVGIDFKAHIISIRSGHASNHAFAKKLFNHIAKTENH